MEGQETDKEGGCTYIIVRVTVRHKGEISTIAELREYRGDGKDAHQDGYCSKNWYGFWNHVTCKSDVRLASPEARVSCM